MHWSIDSLCEAKTSANIKKVKALVKNMSIRGWMTILILFSLIFVSVQSAFLLRDVAQLEEETNRLIERLETIQERSLNLRIVPRRRTPVPAYRKKGETAI